MSQYKATEIDWDFGIDDELVDLLTDICSEETMRTTFGCGREDLTPEEYAQVKDVARHKPGVICDLLGLPSEVELPDNIVNVAIANGTCEMITDWLSDEYGTCINGYTLPEELETKIYTGKDL